MTDDTPIRMNGCACGIDHDASYVCEGLSDAGLRGRVESAVLRAAFPDAMTRRSLLTAVGSATVSAALAQIFPIATATDAFAQSGPLEKTKLAVGFIPITCATPIIMAHPLGFYSKQKLDVDVVKTAGWAVVRDKTINREYDAAHMLAPMPIAISMGLGSTAGAVHGARDREHQRPGDLPCDGAQGPARSEDLEGHEIRDPVRLFQS